MLLKTSTGTNTNTVQRFKFISIPKFQVLSICTASFRAKKVNVQIVQINLKVPYTRGVTRAHFRKIVQNVSLGPL